MLSAEAVTGSTTVPIERGIATLNPTPDRLYDGETSTPTGAEGSGNVLWGKARHEDA